MQASNHHFAKRCATVGNSGARRFHVQRTSKCVASWSTVSHLWNLNSSHIRKCNFSSFSLPANCLNVRKLCRYAACAAPIPHWMRFRPKPNAAIPIWRQIYFQTVLVLILVSLRISRRTVKRNANTKSHTTTTVVAVAVIVRAAVLPINNHRWCNANAPKAMKI